MEPKFKFEKLRIWQMAMDFGEVVDAMVISGFPDKEKFNLSSQIMRAVDSVALIISESSICQTNKEYAKFIGYSMRSLAEVVTCLHKAKRRNYINDVVFEFHYDAAFDLMNMTAAFKTKLK